MVAWSERAIFMKGSGQRRAANLRANQSSQAPCEAEKGDASSSSSSSSSSLLLLLLSLSLLEQKKKKKKRVMRKEVAEEGLRREEFWVCESAPKWS